MERHITDLDELLPLFEDFTASMYRLETLQSYDVAYERADVEAFLAGQAIDLAPGPWQEMIRRHRRAGRQVQRVHVVVEPLSTYLRYEIATAYWRNAAAGEDIRLLSTVQGHWPQGVPTQDYWLFDDQDLWTMEYDTDGRFVAAEHHSDSDAVQRAVAGKHTALRLATPLHQYRPGSGGAPGEAAVS